MNLAIIALLQKKPLEYITVSEICKTAGVNRSTFYLHYETIGDLLAETVRYLLDDFRSYFPADGLDLADSDSNELVFICDKFLTPYLTYIKKNKRIFSTALSHIKTFGLEAVYERMFENIFDPLLDRFLYPTSMRQYVMMYYLNGITAVITQWLKNDCDKSIDELSDIIKICVYGKNNG